MDADSFSPCLPSPELAEELAKERSLSPGLCPGQVGIASCFPRPFGSSLWSPVLNTGYTFNTWGVLKVYMLGLPWWLSCKESAYQFRRHGFDPWSRRIPRVVEQLSLGTTTIEPVL